MNKKYKFILMFIFALFLGINCVEATTYNGSTGITNVGNTSGSCTQDMCNYNNKAHVTVKAQLYYINNGSYTKIGKPIYFYSGNVSFLSSDTRKHNLKITTYNDYGKKWGDIYKGITDYWGLANGVIKDEKEISDNLKKDLNYMATGKESEKYTEKLKTASQSANKSKPATYGYRIILEPVVTYRDNNGNYIAYTPKALAKELSEERINCYSYGCGSALKLISSEDSQAQYFYTEFKDVGVDIGNQLTESDTRRTTCYNINLATLANYTNGCGMHIVDITKAVSPTEPPPSTKCIKFSYKNTLQQCPSSTNEKKTTGEIWENFEVVDVNGDCVGETTFKYTQSPKKVGDIACSGNKDSNGKEICGRVKYFKSASNFIVCYEHLTAHLPTLTNTDKDLFTLNSRFSWPGITTDDMKHNTYKYTMTISDELRCTLSSGYGSDNYAKILDKGNLGENSGTTIKGCDQNGTNCKVTVGGNGTINSASGDVKGILEAVNGQDVGATLYHYSVGSGLELKHDFKNKEIAIKGSYVNPNEKETQSKVTFAVQKTANFFISGEINKCRSCIVSSTNSCDDVKIGNADIEYAGVKDKDGKEKKVKVYVCNKAGISYFDNINRERTYYNYFNPAEDISCAEKADDSTGLVVFGKEQYNQTYYLTLKNIRFGVNKGVRDLLKNTYKKGYSCPYKITTKKCFIKTAKSSGNLKCVNTDENNIAEFKEEYIEKEDCDKDVAEQNKNNTKLGKLIGESDSCSVYCIESAYTSFPGSISGENLSGILGFNTTRYFAWPSNNYKNRNGMPLLMRSTFTCTIVKTNPVDCTDDNISKLKEKVETAINRNKMSVSLEAGTNAKIKMALESYGGNTKITDVTNSKFTVTRETYFKINEKKNRFYNRKTDIASDFNPLTSSGRYIYDRGQGVVSHFMKDDVSKEYYLKLYNVNLGTDNQFGGKITDYVCSYSLTDDKCVCPEGTLRAGESLYEKLTMNKTCSELQATECDICKCPADSDNPDLVLLEGVDSTSKACKEAQETRKADCYSGKNICINNGEEIDLTDCMNKGNSYAVCKAKYCPKKFCEGDICHCTEDCKWILAEQNKTKTYIKYKNYCSGGTEDCGEIKLSCPGGIESMEDAENCMKTELATKLGSLSITEGLNKGKITESDIRRAFAACKSEVCPSSETKIIYRQIDLTNPFPGKKHLGKSFTSNLNIKGRTPGDNWNSETLIKNKILNARGATGYKLYNKDPLYIIELTPSTIKKIRNYNKNHSYDDFNLKCYNVNETSDCISDFVHGKTEEINLSEFLRTSYGNKKSVSSCYNIVRSETGFKKCYNTNN